MTRASCLYEGMLHHRRFEPVEVGFRYPIQLLYLDLAELDGLFDESLLWSIKGRAPARFLRADPLGLREEPLDVSVRRLLTSRLAPRASRRAPDGPIRLLTSPRYFGFVFNPISFYDCFESAGQTLGALVAEVTNTPWGEHHCYVIDLPEIDSDRARTRRRQTPKSFHASPFIEQEMHYEWRGLTPSRSPPSESEPNSRHAALDESGIRRPLLPSGPGPQST